MAHFAADIRVGVLENLPHYNCIVIIHGNIGEGIKIRAKYLGITFRDDRAIVWMDITGKVEGILEV